MFNIDQLTAANYHYKRFTLDYFLDSVERLGYANIELWASGPHLNLEDYTLSDLHNLKAKMKAHNLKLVCFTPESCVYPICVSHPDKAYRDRTVKFYCDHIRAAAELGCDKVLLTPGISYIDVDYQHQWQWSVDAWRKVANVAEQEGVYLPMEAFTVYSTAFFNRARNIKEMIRDVGSPMLKGLADTDVMARTGKDTMQNFVDELQDDLIHVHFVDGHPGGHLVPGDGVLDLVSDLAVLDNANYTGYLSLEILDSRYVFEPEMAMRSARSWFQKYLIGAEAE